MSSGPSIATRTGDDGTTSLLYGQRVAKDHPQIEAVGAFDELNAAIGFAKATTPDPAQRTLLELIQKDLVALMGELACAESDAARYAESKFQKIGEPELARLDAGNDRRRAMAARYADRLAGIPGLGLPRAPQWAEPVWHLYVVRTDRRTELVQALDKAGIGSLIHYPIPPPLQDAYADLKQGRGSYPLAETLAETVLSLPMGPHRKAADVDEVAAVVRRTLV